MIKTKINLIIKLKAFILITYRINALRLTFRNIIEKKAKNNLKKLKHINIYLIYKYIYRLYLNISNKNENINRKKSFEFKMLRKIKSKTKRTKLNFLNDNT